MGYGHQRYHKEQPRGVPVRPIQARGRQDLKPTDAQHTGATEFRNNPWGRAGFMLTTGHGVLRFIATAALAVCTLAMCTGVAAAEAQPAAKAGGRSSYPRRVIPDYDILADYARWTNFIANYKPDYSDSSKYLEPPPTGRLAKPIPIARDGKALAEIVVDLSEAIRIDNFFPAIHNHELRAARGHEVPVARLAANELSAWLFQLTGGDFPVLIKPSAAENVKIYLGATFAKPHFPEDLERLASGGSTDGFAVRVKDGDIYLFGARPAGTLFGVYAFLENNTDIIWGYNWGNDSAVYTEHPNLDVVWADAIEKPVFIHRGWQGGVAEWQRQNRSNFFGNPDDGAFRLNGGHYFSPQYYDYSEGMQRFNPVHRGKRVQAWGETHSLVCLSQPGFFEHASEVVPNVKEIKYSGALYNCVFGIDDNGGVCQCTNCTAPIKTRDGTFITPKDNHGLFYSAAYYTYLNQLDDALQKVWPGYVTSTFAYFFNANFPAIDVNPTIVPWLCTYGRATHNQPISAPVNRGWWKRYRDWMGHSSEIMLYAYYGLGDGFLPLAEAHQFDLKAQRAIGFLRNSTEGSLKGHDVLGTADERWCVTRLDWNPDQDVEQLHRYFNRRVYREAAPWMDRFRGTIRQVYFANGCKGDLPAMLRRPETARELRHYMDEAVKAVQHPTSRLLVEMASARLDDVIINPKPPTAEQTFDAMVKKLKRDGKKVGDVLAPAQLGTMTLPGEIELDVDFDRVDKENAAEAEKARSKAARVSRTRFAEQTAREWRTIRNAAKAGDTEQALALLERIYADRRRPAETNHVIFLETLYTLVSTDSKFTADQINAVMRKYYPDDVSRAIGWMTASPRTRWEWPAVVQELANRLAARGDLDGADAIYTAWRDWDGDNLPLSMRIDRQWQRVAFFRNRMKPLARSAGGAMLQRPESQLTEGQLRERQRYLELAKYETRATEEWVADLRRGITECATANQRASAFERLMNEEWGTKTKDERIAALDRLIEDKFLANPTRQRATLRIPEAHTENGVTDWKGVAEHTLRAIGSGDWSQLKRSCYVGLWRGSSDRDMRLDALCAIADRMVAANEIKIAQSLLERGAPIIGYPDDFDPTKVKELGATAGDLAARLKRLDTARVNADLPPINKYFVGDKKREIPAADVFMQGGGDDELIMLDEL